MVPTLLLVILTAFVISRIVPGDIAQSVLSMQGINPESSSYPTEYMRAYTSLGLDKPNFYFSVVPDYYPENLNAIISQDTRSYIKTLLRQKYSYNEIKNFLDAKEALIKELDTVKVEKVVQFKTALASHTGWDDLESTALPTPEDPVLARNPQWNKYSESWQILKDSRAGFYMPKFVWHGTQNQFHSWVKGIYSGNLGHSIKDGRAVSFKIRQALGWTLILVFFNMTISVLISLPAGLAAGYYNGGRFDRWSGILWLALYSVPVFWLASLLVTFFTQGSGDEWYRIFPVPGTWHTEDNIFGFLLENGSQLILPVICLVANDIAQLSRLVRDNVINQKSKLYILMVRAKGLDDYQVMKKHILPNALIPLITAIGGKIPSSLSGALIVEVIFNIPGMGRLMFDSIRATDWNVVFGIIIIISVFTIFFMLLTDVIYAYVNPKIQFN